MLFCQSLIAIFQILLNVGFLLVDLLRLIHPTVYVTDFLFSQAILKRYFSHFFYFLGIFSIYNLSLIVEGDKD